MTTYRQLCAQITEAIPVLRAAEAENPSQTFVTVDTGGGATRGFKPGELLRGYTAANATCALRADEGRMDDEIVAATPFYILATAVVAEASRRRTASPPATPPSAPPSAPRSPPTRVRIPPAGPNPWLAAGAAVGVGVFFAWVVWS